MFRRIRAKIIALFAIVCSLAISGCVSDNVKQTLRNIPQNIWNYIDPALIDHNLINSDDQKKHLLDFLSHYFSPWTNQKRIYTDQQILQSEITDIQEFTQNPGWGENHQPYNQRWIKNIINTMDISHFPNNLHKAIIIETADIRVLPTNEPSYSNWKNAGEGYPFDNIQQSLVTVGTPVQVLQTTTNGIWSLILTNDAYGWVKTNAIVRVDDNFINKYQTKNYIAITADHSLLIDDRYNIEANLGAIFPLIKQTENSYEILIPVKDIDNNAQTHVATVSINNAAIMPIILQTKNIASLANNLLGNPYGWGGMYQYRDCSSTIEDLLTPFAMWLPRNSSAQMKIGDYIPLNGLSRKDKKESIVSHGIPFLTLIGLPGHVMLYIGHSNGSIYVLQNIWGLHTRPPFMPFLTEGRAIIGQTIIVPLEFDKHYLNVPVPLIDKVNGMTVL